MPQRRSLSAVFGLLTVFMLLFGVRADCGQASEKVRVDSETTIDVKPGTTRLDTKVGSMDFTYAKIEMSPPANGIVKVRLKVAGTNVSDHDHDAEVKATLVGDQVNSSITKKREIEEGEHDKELSFEFRATTEQVASGLRFKLTLSYLP